MSGDPSPFHVEIATGPARLREIKPDWTALSRRTSASVFQSHAWVEAWWSALDDGAEHALRIALAWRGDVLVAVLALATGRRQGLRALEWAAKEHTDYCDALVDPRVDAQAIVRLLWASVLARGGFDVAYLSHLKPDSVLFRLACGPDGPLALSHRSETSLRVLSAWRTGEEWQASQNKKSRQNYRRGRKALAETAPVTFREVEDDGKLDGILDQLIALKRDWLSRTGNASSLLVNGGAPLKAYVAVMAQAGILRLFVLECGGRIVAGTVNFVEAGRMMAFFAAYDPEFERASVGTLLMHDYMMRAFDEGIGEIDFLCGTEEYKLKFSNREVGLAVAVAGRTLLGKAALLVDATAARLRAWRESHAVPGTTVDVARGAAPQQVQAG